MKNKMNLTKMIFRICGACALTVFMFWTANASAVRSVVASQSQSGQILGGSAAIGSVPNVVTIHRGSFYVDSSADGNVLVFASSSHPSEFVPGVGEVLGITTITNFYVRNRLTGDTICLTCRFSPMAGDVGLGGLYAAITPDGRYVVYDGASLDGLSTFRQIFRLDLQTGVTDVVSVGAGGGQGNLDSRYPVVSADGRYVAFMSTASNLVANYPNVNTQQVFVRDMQMGQTFLASHAQGSASMPGNSAVDITQPLSISDNGRFTVWTSPASNHLAILPDNNNVNDVYFFDVLGPIIGNIGAASLNSTTSATANGASSGGVIAENSATFPPTIAFVSSASNINPADPNTNPDVYCYKGQSTVRLVSIARDGTSANGVSSNFRITPNGRYVAFTSKASNLVDGINEANNTTNDVFLRDLQTNTTSYVSMNSNNVPSATTSGATVSDITEDAHYVSFSTSEPMSVRDNQNTQDAYVRDTTAGISILVTLNKNLTGGQNGNAGGAFFTANGRKAFYTASGTNIFPGDTTTTQNYKIGLAEISLLASRSASDFNGDHNNDYAVWRASETKWFSLFDAISGEYSSLLFGESSDRIVPGDYDGDGKTDHAVFIPAFGRWDIIQSSNNLFTSRFFGTANDVLVPADYDGDGRTDLAFFRPSNATWYILQSNTGSLRSTKFGLTGDIPVVGDYDGDNRADIAVFRPSSGDWWILRSSDNSYYSFHWGISTDKPAAGDFDGDGKSDAAVFRNGIWYILRSRDGSYYIFQWGLGTDRIVPSDYDGDGRTDLAVWRPSDGIWYIIRSSDDAKVAVPWGINGDTPLPAAYLQ